MGMRMATLENEGSGVVLVLGCSGLDVVPNPVMPASLAAAIFMPTVSLIEMRGGSRSLRKLCRIYTPGIVLL